MPTGWPYWIDDSTVANLDPTDNIFFLWPESHTRHIRVKKTVGYIALKDAKNYCPTFPMPEMTREYPWTSRGVAQSLPRVAATWPPHSSSPVLSESQGPGEATQRMSTSVARHLSSRGGLESQFACSFSLFQNCSVRINSCRDRPVHD